MRRAFLLVCMLAAGSAAGQAAPKLKFPWAGDAWNQGCGKTELEWRCVEKRIDARPVVLDATWQLTAMLVDVCPGGLQVKLNIEPRVNVNPKVAANPNAIQAGIFAAQTKLVESILSYSPPPPAGVDPQLVREKPFENLSNTRIEFYVKGRLYKAKGLTPAQLAGR